jgi:hypothetical protein
MSGGSGLLLGADAAEEVHEGVQEDGGAIEDENSNQVDAVSLCRVCGDNMGGEARPALKFSKPLPAALSKLNFEAPGDFWHYQVKKRSPDRRT